MKDKEQILDYESAPKSDPRIARRFWVLVFAGGTAGFLGWIGLDFVLVRFAPSHIHDFDPAIYLFPVYVGLSGMISFRKTATDSRIILSIVAAVLASFIAIAPILFVGFRFHFWIGGTL